MFYLFGSFPEDEFSNSQRDYPSSYPSSSTTDFDNKGRNDQTGNTGKLNLSDRKNFIMNYLQPALEVEVIEMTIPDNPRNSIQRYKLTRLGKKILEETKNK